MVLLCLLAGTLQRATAAATTPVSDRAYPLLLQRTLTNRASFFVYRDADSAANHGFPSGFFGATHKVHIDTACVDDPASPTGCSTNLNILDRERGNVVRISFDPLSDGEWAGVNFEEPENWGGTKPGAGYDLRGVTQLAVCMRCPTPGGMYVQFGVAGYASDPYLILHSNSYSTIPVYLVIPPANLTNVHILFSVAVSAAHPPSSGTLLIDWVKFLPVPPSQANALGFPVATETFGVVPRSGPATNREPWPADQLLRNLSTPYESALTALALLDRGNPADVAAARVILDSFAYGLTNDNQGDPLPATNGWFGLHNGYMAGDLPLFNSQGPGKGQQGQVRLAGFTVPTNPPAFYLVLDGATGGNVSFAILSLCAGYKKTAETRYLDAARGMARWIVHYLKDSTGTNYAGYYLGYPDKGEPKVLIRSKSIENNADIFAAFTALAELERLLGNPSGWSEWTTHANAAGDFVLQMFDPALGRFWAGAVPLGTPPGPGVTPDGPQRGAEVINTFDFLDAATFTTLALAESPRYRNLIDWRRPVQFMTNEFAQVITAGGRQYHGFNLLKTPQAGPNGIAWEFTGQAVATMSFVDGLYGQSGFATAAANYLSQIRQAQTNAPFGDGLGLAASTVENGDALEPIEQCLSTTFQAIPERVGLAATTWAIFAETGFNPLAPDILFKIKTARLSGGKVLLTFTTLAGKTYRVEWSSDLNTWNLLTNNVPGTGAGVQVSDILQPTGKRFYRAGQNP